MIQAKYVVASSSRLLGTAKQLIFAARWLCLLSQESRAGCLFPSPGRGWVVGGRCCWWPRRGKVGSPGLTSPLPLPSPPALSLSPLSPSPSFWGGQHLILPSWPRSLVPLSLHPAVGLPQPWLQLPALLSLQSYSFHPLLQRKGNLIYFKGRTLRRIHLQDVCEPMALMRFLASN